MFYLIETISTTYFNCPCIETSTKIVVKSNNKTKLQEIIKEKYEDAKNIWDLNDDDCINGASIEEIDEMSDEVEYFDENYLSIYRQPSDLGVQAEYIVYCVVSDENIEEVD